MARKRWKVWLVAFLFAFGMAPVSAGADEGRASAGIWALLDWLVQAVAGIAFDNSELGGGISPSGAQQENTDDSELGGHFFPTG